jgi:phosphoglycolate phosphatase-like HAD superfamily hydrolase
LLELAAGRAPGGRLGALVGARAGDDAAASAAHLALAAGSSRYVPDHVLMIGDAPGDMDAARANGFLFFPINPGREDASWERFYRESYARFTGGTYAGAYEAELIQDFLALLPEVPWWQK